MTRRRRPSARIIANRLRDDRRRAELAELRLQRPLTDAEKAEDDRLTHNLAMRVWRDAQRETEFSIQQAARLKLAADLKELTA